MNLLELLHNEKVVRLLEKIDTDLKDITEPGMKSNSIFLKIIMIVESLLKKSKHPNSHIGEYFERYWDNQTNIDDINEEIKQSDVTVSKLSYDMDMRKVEIEELEWKLNELKGKMDFDKGEIASIKGKLEGMNWEPTKLKDFINEPSFKIDEKGHEGWLFEKLKKELIENNKLNYNYGRDKQK
jgi:chromosome segregation ATPase